MASLLFLQLLILLPTAFCAGSLPAYNVDIDRSSVSGLSSGGFFAVQLHVAFSSNIIGAGIFAGGPYDCAAGSVGTATGSCMTGSPAPSASTAISKTNSRASSGQLDPPANLKGQNVYLFSGTKDSTVVPAVMNQLNDYYEHFESNVQYVNTMNAAHTQPTNDPANTNACTTSASPYLSDCDYDGAGQSLSWIYGNLNAPNTGTLSGQFIEFDQTEFISGRGMASTGWLYVPKDCSDGQACYLHVALHGCLQYYGTIGDKYVKHAGYNPTADSNRIIVLYPQATSSYLSPTNPNGCWDWWGYNGDTSTYDTKSGYQMAAIYKMMQRIASGFITVPPPSGLTVTSATDNTLSLQWDAVSGVSGYNLYRDGSGSPVTSSPITSTSYTDSGLASGSTYTYAATSVLAGGAESQDSASVQGTTTGKPPPMPAPTGLTVASTTSSSISLKWDVVSGAADYNIYRNGSVVTHSSPLESPAFNDSGLAPLSSYSYQVTALNMLGEESPKSLTVIGITQSSWQCTEYTASNYAQVTAGRAYQSGGYCYANGSDDYMGLYNTFTQSTLAETSSGYYVVGSCAGKPSKLNGQW